MIRDKQPLPPVFVSGTGRRPDDPVEVSRLAVYIHLPTVLWCKAEDGKQPDAWHLLNIAILRMIRKSSCSSTTSSGQQGYSVLLL